jgi:hypothetical protein
LEFCVDAPNLSGSAVKAYIALQRFKQIGETNADRTLWASCSYETLGAFAGIKSKGGVRYAVLELAEHGWIKDFRRGGYVMKKGRRVNIPNKYLLSDEKLNSHHVEKVLQKFGEKNK